MNGKPKACTEENCRHIYRQGEGDMEKPLSSWCFGVRTGIINGKGKACKKYPDDVMVYCLLLGSHSDMQGKYCFIENIPDQYLEIRSRFIALHDLGLLKRTLKRILYVSGHDIRKDIMDALKETKKHTTIEKGARFIEFQCSCGEIFFREYVKDYKLTNEDKIFIDVHRKLNHHIRYFKAKFTGNKWRMYGPYNYEKTKR